VNIWHRVVSLFLPRARPPLLPSPFDGDPNQARFERPRQPRSQTRWLQSDIERAIIASDTGDLSAAARLSRSLRRDGAFSGLLSTRAGGLTRLPRIYRGTPEVVADLDMRDDIGLFDRIHSPKELELLDADGIVLGVGVGEYLNLPDRREPVFVRLDPEFLRYRWSEDRWYFESAEGPLLITPGDGRWVLHTPGGYLQPWQSGLWPSLGRAFVAKEHAYLYRENYSGKLANPARVAVSPAGASEPDKEGFFQRVMAWGLNTVFGLPPGWDVKLIESSGRGYEVFQQTIESADREFMIGIAGQIVTVDGGAGFANANIHATIRSDLIQGDGQALASTINEQGLRPIINRLYGSASRGAIEWDTRPPGDLSKEAQAIMAAAQAMEAANRVMQSYGVRVDAAEIATRFRIPTYPLEIASDRYAEDAPLEDGAAQALADKMTAFGVSRCEHGASNRCRLCGVERLRDFEIGPDGEQQWRVLWRPIARTDATPALKLLQGGAT
jgi:hypothetical protein